MRWLPLVALVVCSGGVALPAAASAGCVAPEIPCPCRLSDASRPVRASVLAADAAAGTVRLRIEAGLGETSLLPGTEIDATWSPKLPCSNAPVQLEPGAPVLALLRAADDYPPCFEVLRGYCEGPDCPEEPPEPPVNDTPFPDCSSPDYGPVLVYHVRLVPWGATLDLGGDPPFVIAEEQVDLLASRDQCKTVFPWIDPGPCNDVGVPVIAQEDPTASDEGAPGGCGTGGPSSLLLLLAARRRRSGG